MLTILAVGEDVHLLRSRAAILRKTGGTVVCCSAAESFQLIAEQEFGLIVLCHSVHPADAARITDAAHRPGAQTMVLLLVADRLVEREYSGIQFDSRAFVEPACLLRASTELLRRHRGSSTGVTADEGNMAQSGRKKLGNYPSEIAMRRMRAGLVHRRAG